MDGDIIVYLSLDQFNYLINDYIKKVYLDEDTEFMREFALNRLNFSIDDNDEEVSQQKLF